ncbi:hypothetical protein [Novosphingobium sp. M1R2S20]|uniref:DNA-binding MarR family transcriptional regulator n=1 Tax=Novosphingobium rhizovicinum TaxID=3228928 RepID=A0ABV3R8A7_9SPHN
MRLETWIGRDKMPSERLERYAAELMALAEQMRQEGDEPSCFSGLPVSGSSLSREGQRGVNTGSSQSGVHRDNPSGQSADRARVLSRWFEIATRLYRFRRRRDRVFGAIFGEPAWDILLDLFIMEARGKRVPVSSACIASGASHSTALRQIDELVRHKLVCRERDESDKRRTYLRLSDEGLTKMATALEQLADEGEVEVSEELNRARASG